MRTARSSTVCDSVTRCQHWLGVLSEQIWTGFQYWPLDVTIRGSQCGWGGILLWEKVRPGPGSGPLQRGPPPHVNRHNWKHYLPAASLADGNNVNHFLRQQIVTNNTEPNGNLCWRFLLRCTMNTSSFYNGRNVNPFLSISVGKCEHAVISSLAYYRITLQKVWTIRLFRK